MNCNMAQLPFEVSVDRMIDVIRREDGVIFGIADYFKVSRDTIYSFIRKHPELQVALDEARANKYEKMLDLAESVIEKTMQSEEHIKIAQDSAKFTIDRRGKKRGWGDGDQNNFQTKIKSQLDILASWTDSAYAEIKEREGGAE